MAAKSSSLYDHMFRYIIVGDMAVGKSCLLLQFTDHKFRHQHELTIGVEFGGKTIEVKGKNIKIQIWDTAGQEAFQAITRTYYKGAIGALLVYDITRHETFEHIDRWLNEIKANGSKDICCLIFGNKALISIVFIIFSLVIYIIRRFITIFLFCFFYRI